MQYLRMTCQKFPQLCNVQGTGGSIDKMQIRKEENPRQRPQAESTLTPTQRRPELIFMKTGKHVNTDRHGFKGHKNQNQIACGRHQGHAAGSEKDKGVILPAVDP